MRKTLSLILAFVLVASLFVGCGASTNDKAEYAPMEDSMISNGSAMGGDYDGVKNESSTADKETAESDTDLYLDSQKLIYNCNIEMETLTFPETIAEIKAMIKEYEGFIESDSMSDDSWNWYYSEYKKNSGTMYERIVARIPTKNYNTFVNALDGSGKIMSKSENVINITKSYNDTSTTIEMLEKEEEMLLTMMEQCATIQEMLSVESRLSEVQQRLAIYRSSLGDMDMDIAFSTVTISIREVKEHTKPVAEELKFIERFVDAVKDSAEEFIDFAEDVIIFLVYVAPYAVVCAVVIVVIKITTKNKKADKKKAMSPKTKANDVQVEKKDDNGNVDKK